MTYTFTGTPYIGTSLPLDNQENPGTRRNGKTSPGTRMESRASPPILTPQPNVLRRHRRHGRHAIPPFWRRGTVENTLSTPSLCSGSRPLISFLYDSRKPGTRRGKSWRQTSFTCSPALGCLTRLIQQQHPWIRYNFSPAWTRSPEVR